MWMKRLFMLRHGKGGAVVRGEDNSPLYFESKPAAKAERDKREGTVVSYGPDHDKFNQQHGVK
jgi:hypothetical protein